MKVRSILLVMLIILVGSSATWSQGNNRGPVLWVDSYRFPESDTTCIVELFYAVERNSIRFREGGGFFVADAEIRNEIFRGDSLIFTSAIALTDTISSRDDLKPGQQILEFRRYRFRPGKYAVVATLTDKNSGLTRTVTDTLDVLLRQRNILTRSDLILASRLIRSDVPSSAYWRNGLEVVPNVSRIYGKGLETLGFYGEVYGLRVRPDGQYCYSMDVVVSDEFGRTPVHYSGRTHSIGGSSCAVHGTVSVGELDNGTYMLTVTVHDCVTGDSVQFYRHFFVVRPKTLASGQTGSEGSSKTAQASEYAVMSETQLDSLFDLVKYIASREEQDVYPHLDLEGKRRFMANFWRRRDPDPSTPENEVQMDYFRRVAYANVHFSYAHKRGWKTDRGRVLLQYGWPDQVDRQVGEVMQNPYEIWTYEKLQGGIQFVFVDRRRIGEYELVHSTAVGEIKDENWTQYLYH